MRGVRATPYIFLGLAALALGPNPATAQDAPSATASSATTTVPTSSAPTRRSSRRPRASGVVASFPGFRMMPDGTSRCFVHLSASVATTSHASGRRFEVTLPGAVVHVRNHLHPLETRFFNTPMLRARLERRGRGNLVLVVELRADVTATMHVDPVQTGGVDVVVELPAGRFVEGPPQIGGSVELSQSEIEGSSGSTRPAARDDAVRAAPGGSVRPSAASTQPSPSGASTTPPARTSAPSRAEPPTGEDDERPPIFGGQ